MTTAGWVDAWPQTGQSPLGFLKLEVEERLSAFPVAVEEPLRFRSCRQPFVSHKKAAGLPSTEW